MAGRISGLGMYVDASELYICLYATLLRPTGRSSQHFVSQSSLKEQERFLKPRLLTLSLVLVPPTATDIGQHPPSLAFFVSARAVTCEEERHDRQRAAMIDVNGMGYADLSRYSPLAAETAPRGTPSL